MPTDKPAVTLTREELYALIWKKPMTTLGKEFGVTGNAISKVCKKLNVPVPGRGHWAKLAHGKRPHRLRLPPPSAGTPKKATIDPRDSIQFPKPDPVTSPDGSAVVIDAIAIPEDLRGCHPLISATRKALNAQKPNSDGLLWINQPGNLNITVSRQSIPRGLRIMEALIREFLARGWTIETSDKARMTKIGIGSDPVGISLTEKLDRSLIEVSEKRKAESWYRPAYQYRPNGNLVLRITDSCWDGLRMTWGDGKQQRLERMLPDFIAGMELMSESLKKRRLKWEERDRQWAEEKRLREEREAQIKRETERREALFRQTEGWKKPARSVPL